MGLFQGVKDAAGILDVCAYYGIAVNNRNKALCPLHGEKTPSFYVYPATESFYCFGCGAGGDVITLVAALFNETPFQAAKRIAGDFNVKTAAGSSGARAPVTAAAVINEREYEAAFDEVYWRVYSVMCDKRHKTAGYIDLMSKSDPFNIHLSRAYDDLLALDYWTDTMLRASDEERAALLNQLFEEVTL